MRRLWTAPAVLLAAALGGCGSGKVEPVTVTPELEAKLKAEQEQADSEEKEMYKQVGGSAPKKRR